MTNKRFIEAIRSDDLVLVTGWRSQKQHILRVLHSKYEAQTGTGYYARSIFQRTQPRDEREALAWRGLLSGRTLCHSDGGGYYFRPQMELWREDGRCPRCFQRWRTTGSPPVKGWTAPIEDVIDWPLPFGWQEVSAIGHVWDVPPDGDPDQVRDQTGDVVGERRTELRRWQRGPCVVRLVHHYADNAYTARYHAVGTPLREHTFRQGAIALCTRAAWELMGKGGRP
jgi:hypothetical protein